MKNDIPAPLELALALQREAYHAHPVPGYDERVADLRTLQRFIRENKDALCDAISADYGHRSKHETLLAEIFPAVDGIDHVVKHLRGWMKPQRRAVDKRNFLGARNRVIPQPLGVVGVIVPWNFPVNLSMVPLSYIFAAGNRAMVKMSENSRHLARLLIEKTPAYFPPEKLQFFDEVGGVGIAFSKLPFDHLLFTGSGQTGRAVMAAAAQNLCPVTLELGGKAPAILCDDFPLRKAAERILFVKYLNAGQICTSVDHLWMPQARIAQFVEEARRIVPKRYPTLASQDYTAIIDQKAFDRLLGALDEARERGAQIIQLLPGPAHDAATRKIAPCIVLDAPPDSIVWQREIFGPILPILKGISGPEEAIDFIRQRPKPLALYIFSGSSDTAQFVLERTSSGTASVNDCLTHYGVPYVVFLFRCVFGYTHEFGDFSNRSLPFGGVGDSGMGSAHGTFSFDAFSHKKGVFWAKPIAMLESSNPRYPPYTDSKLNFIKNMSKCIIL